MSKGSNVQQTLNYAIQWFFNMYKIGIGVTFLKINLPFAKSLLGSNTSAAKKHG